MSPVQCALSPTSIPTPMHTQYLHACVPTRGQGQVEVGWVWIPKETVDIGLLVWWSCRCSYKPMFANFQMPFSAFMPQWSVCYLGSQKFKVFFFFFSEFAGDTLEWKSTFSCWSSCINPIPPPRLFYNFLLSMNIVSAIVSFFRIPVCLLLV